MPTRQADLGDLETMVMLAALRLADDATARNIRHEVRHRGGRRLSRGATYVTLGRLEEKGYLERGLREPEDGGRATHVFQVTDPGLSTLRTVQGNLWRMQEGLESILGLPS